MAVKKKEFKAVLGFCSILVCLLSAVSVFAQTPAPSTPSVPEFTVKFEARPYDVPPIYGIDQQTMQKVTIEAGYHVENKSVIITIKNQALPDALNNSLSWLAYNVRLKEDDQIYAQVHQSDSEYSTLAIRVDNYALGNQVAVRVQALFMSPGYVIGISDWSNTQTVTIPDFLPTPSPSPSPSMAPFSFDPVRGDFSIIVLPDTQGYTKYYPWIFDNQTQWIIDNKDEFNVVFVSQLGDIVDQTDNQTQWENANRSLSKLDGNVPWSLLPGNHDRDGFNLTNYNEYFGFDRFSGNSWYGGAYEENNTNSYDLFSAGGIDFLILNLQYDPSDAVLSWAGNLINQNPERRVIVSTHDYMLGLNGLGQRSEVGERIWQGLIKPHADQIFLVLCGHSGAEDLIVDNVDGHIVYQVLADFANNANFQSGWVRILEFSPSQDKIYARTYSPLFDEYKSGSQSEFILEYNMTNGLNPDLLLWIILPLAITGILTTVVITKRKQNKASIA